MNKIIKYLHLPIFLISLFYTFSLTISNSYAAETCGAYECGTGTYVCQNGTYCCTGGGCPTWECKTSGYVLDGFECCFLDVSTGNLTTDCENASLTSGTCAPCAGTGQDSNTGGGSNCTGRTMGTLYRHVSPAHGATLAPGTTAVRLRWSDVRTRFRRDGVMQYYTWWGRTRVSCRFNNYYEVYLLEAGKSWVKVGKFAGGSDSSGAGTLSTVVRGLTPGKRYYWYSKAINSAIGASRRDAIATWTFYIPPAPLPPTVTVQGTIWDATDSSCSISSGSRDSKEIPRSALDGSISVIADSISGDWNPSGGAQSYAVSDVTKGDSKTVCANLPAPADLPNFKYSLECVNGSTSGRLSASCATVDIQNSPTTIDLGFKLSSHGWFQVNNADIFANCSSCIDSISLGIPAISDVLGGFEDALIAGKGIVFGNSDLSVKNPSGDTKLTSDDNDHWAKGLEDADFVPPSFLSVAQNFDEDTFTNVSGGDCNNLLTGGAKVNNVYSMTRDCAQDAIDNISAGTDYNLSTDAEGDNTGVTFLFVAKNSGSSDPLVFIEEFKSNSSNKRVVFIVQDSIEIDSSLGIDLPTDSSSPSIEAGLISVESINFPSAESDEGDSTVIVEGPIVALTGSISFERDRLENNGYPATVVIYNPFYLTGISSNVKALVGLIDITWILEN